MEETVLEGIFKPEQVVTSNFRYRDGSRALRTRYVCRGTDGRKELIFSFDNRESYRGFVGKLIRFRLSQKIGVGPVFDVYVVEPLQVIQPPAMTFRHAYARGWA